jgi:hypothetical protein
MFGLCFLRWRARVVVGFMRFLFLYPGPSGSDRYCKFLVASPIIQQLVHNVLVLLDLLLELEGTVIDDVKSIRLQTPLGDDLGA